VDDSAGISVVTFFPPRHGWLTGKISSSEKSAVISPKGPGWTSIEKSPVIRRLAKQTLVCLLQ